MNTTGAISSFRAAIAFSCILMLPFGMLVDELANAPGRSDTDKARDAQRKPDQTLTARLGIVDHVGNTDRFILRLRKPE